MAYSRHLNLNGSWRNFLEPGVTVCGYINAELMPNSDSQAYFFEAT
ncbi:hypothetical protein [Methylovulum miyakonense]